MFQVLMNHARALDFIGQAQFTVQMGLSYVVKLKLLQPCSNWLPSTVAFYIRERTLPYSSLLLQKLNWLLVSCSICIFSGCQEKFLEQSLIPENYFGVSEHYRHWNEKNRKECGGKAQVWNTCDAFFSLEGNSASD